MKHKSFAIFILTHNRADRVYTVKALQKSGYRGKIYFVLDDTDKEIEKYKKNFGAENVVIFNKAKALKSFDIMDNFDDDRAVVFARNAVFDIAKELGIKHFWVLDGDYSGFYYRYDRKLNFITKLIKDLETILDSMIDFFEVSGALSVAMAQAGDFIGGDNGFYKSPLRLRKCMNSFICSTERPFTFSGRINEDVNTYTGRAKYGDLFFTIPFLAVVQKATQSNAGGLTDIYLNLGTYVKSFYSVMMCPSSIKVALMGETHKRLHHNVRGVNTYPMIINDKYK